MGTPTMARRAYKAAWSKAHAAESRAWVKNWRKAHPAETRAYTAAYNKTHAAEKRAYYDKRRALKLSAMVQSWTDEQEEAHIDRLGRCCFYCDVPWVRGAKTGHLDHVVPLARGGAHALSNIVPACPPCNLSKHDKLLCEWLSPERLAIIEAILRLKNAA